MLIVLYQRFIGPLCENMNSSTKPEVHNVSQRRHRTEPRLQATCTKIGEVRPFGFQVMRADRQ